MILYRTVQKETEAEQTIEKSRFIAHIKPVSDKDEADSFVAYIKSEYKTATHNVPAYVIGDKMQIQWASDDGEPQGTSGAPIVQMLVKEGITNVVIVVTRYFGGIKLGTGGLVRAYTGSAKLALEAAGICEVRDMMMIDFRVDYSSLGRIQNIAEQTLSAHDDDMLSFEIKNILYEDTVVLTISVNPENTEKLKLLIANITSGTAEVLSERIELTKNMIL